jgi:hypothetical protein
VRRIGMNQHTVLGVPLLKNDSPRRIDRVIDYFGEGRRAPESTGGVDASQPWVIQDDE